MAELAAQSEMQKAVECLSTWGMIMLSEMLVTLSAAMKTGRWRSSYSQIDSSCQIERLSDESVAPSRLG